jgi:TonB-linked SusC/RagA family outer membrane protein
MQRRKLLMRSAHNALLCALLTMASGTCVYAAGSPNRGESDRTGRNHYNADYFDAGSWAKPITGKVVDEKGEPLQGVTVAERGTNNSTVTDQAGNFRLEVASDASVLVFSHVGFLSITEQVGSRATFSITLNSNANTLTDVVVTALGIKREAKKLGYSATTANIGEIQKNRTANLMTGLEGKIAGLDISPPAAGAGASNKIRLRGQSALAGPGFTPNNSPLIVINGLPMDQGARGANGSGDQTDDGDNLSLINPDDIETMTVLKGATAAALYGSRAANGAIIITTKTGNKNSGIGVELTSSYNAEQAIDLTDWQYVYGQGTGGNRPTAGDVTLNGQYGFGAKYDGVPTIQFDGVLRPYSPQKDRVKDFFRIGNTLTNTLAVSGGNAKGSFRASFTHMEGEGIVPNNWFNRKIFNLGVNHNLTEQLSVQVNVNYTNEHTYNPPFVGSQGAGYTNFLYRMAPNIPLSAFRESAFDADGNERRTTNFNTTLLNPYFDMAKRFYKTKRDRLLSTALVRYEVAKWLYLQGRATMDFNSDFNEQNVPTGSGAVSNVSLIGAGNAYTGSYTLNTGTDREMNLDFLAGTNHTIGDFSVDVSVGGNSRIVNSRGQTQRAASLIVRDLYAISNALPSSYAGTPGAAETSSSTYGISRLKVNSLYAFADIGYKNLVFLNLTGREDWFSVLNPKNNHFFYPSVSGSFIFSELLKDVSWLNYGKLRGGVAVVGSANGIGAFAGLLNYNIGSFANYLLGNLPNTNPNPDLEPYGVTETELGLELRALKSRVSLDVAVYKRVSKDQIVSLNNSNASGYGSQVVNLGKTENKGIEVLLEGSPIKTKAFTWNSSFNVGYNATKVLSLSGLNESVVQRFNDGAELFGEIWNVVGMPMNQITGRSYLRNAKGEILVTGAGALRQTASNVYFGSALPKYTGGWNNVFSYNNLSLLVHIDFKAGGKMLSGTALNALRQGFSKASLVGRRDGENGIIFPGVYDNGNPNTSVQTNLQSFYGSYRSLNLLDPFVFKSDFVKLRNITLSYNFTSLIGSKLKFVKGLVLSASCRNVAIIKKYTPDIDPESVQSTGDFRVGYEQSALPTARNYGLNLNVKF